MPDSVPPQDRETPKEGVNSFPPQEFPTGQYNVPSIHIEWSKDPKEREEQVRSTIEILFNNQNLAREKHKKLREDLNVSSRRSLRVIDDAQRKRKRQMAAIMAGMIAFWEVIKPLAVLLVDLIRGIHH